MTLELLQSAMVVAMKERNKQRKDAISALIGAVKKAAIDKRCKDNITEELVNEVVLKEKKTVQEMIDTCPATRQDLLNEYKYRLAVINEFAPKMMTEDEVRSVIKDIITNSNMEKLNKGTIMKAIVPVLKGKTDMKIVNAIVAEVLSN